MDTNPQASSSFSSKIKAFDFYRKLPQDISEKSSSGGLVSLICASIIVVLFISEFSRFLSTSIRSQMVIETDSTDKELRINIDVTFDKVGCGFLTVDGRSSLFSNTEVHIYRQRIDSNGKPMRGVPPTPGEQVETDLAKMREMIANSEGCQIFGSLTAKRISGFIYINERRPDSIHGLNANKVLNFSHRVNSISFGDIATQVKLITQLNTTLNPLEGHLTQDIKPDTPASLIQYYLNVVPIKLKPLYSAEVNGFQYTAHSHKVDYYHKNHVVIKYDVSPISVHYTVEREEILHFLVEISAIIGGIFTLARVLDSTLYKLLRTRGGKADLE